MTERFFLRMLAIGLTAMLLYGCTPSGTSLSGHFENSGGILFLDEITPEKTVVTLDTILLVNGNFNYRFKPEYEGQMRLYLRYLNQNERKSWEESPIGLILWI